MAENKDTRSPKMKTVVKAICEKFDDSKILKRPGLGGKIFFYVKAQEYIVKLNDVFGVAWSAEIVQHWMMNNQVIMLVRVTYPNPDNPDQLFWKDGVGGHPITDNKGNLMDPGNVFKSAYSKAFTKAAAQIGAGLHLWGVDSDEDDTPVWDQVAPAGGLPVVSSVGGPPVTVVNPGLHNPVSIPGMPPVPQYSMNTAGNSSPQPTGNPLPPPPQFVNNRAETNVTPNMSPMPTPPLPTGNPAAVGFTSGLNTSASAAVGITSAGRGGIEAFQVNGILGAAVTKAMNPLQLIANVLGDIGITAVEQLTAEQAQRVLDAVRHMPPQ